MVWKCPPLNLFNWNNLWKWKELFMDKPRNAFDLYFEKQEEVMNTHYVYTKTCTGCGKEKPLSQYHICKHGKNQTYYKPQCNVCRLAQQSAYRKRMKQNENSN